MSKLRQSMIDDLKIRNRSPKTIDAYVRCVLHCAKFFWRSPADLTPEDIREFQIYLRDEKKYSWPAFNQHVCALRFLYGVTLKRKDFVEQIPFAKTPKKKPVILSREEVASLLQATSNFKYRTMMATIYATGLRASEACQLKVQDVDSHRMIIRIDGKGQKERHVPLFDEPLKLLRSYCRTYQPNLYLFYGQSPIRPLSYFPIQHACLEARKAALRGPLGAAPK